MNKDFHSKEITAVHLPKLCNITRGECFRVLIVMKTTFFLIILFSLKLSAGAYSQTISLSMKDGSMRKAIREIRDQSGTDFIYDPQYLRNARPVTVQFKDIPLEQALQQFDRKSTRLNSSH